ncbi:MAG: hypothetical protein ACNS61_00905 [Candidatus Wenzhouxiangella sp. M2_3B_020]
MQRDVTTSHCAPIISTPQERFARPLRGFLGELLPGAPGSNQEPLPGCFARMSLSAHFRGHDCHDKRIVMTREGRISSRSERRNRLQGRRFTLMSDIKNWNQDIE